VSEETKKALEDVAAKLWDLANRITAFAVLQMLATLFLIAKDGVFAKVLWENTTLAVVASSFMGFGYAFAVNKCCESEKKIRNEARQPKLCLDTAELANRGRIISICIVTVLGVIAMLVNLVKGVTH
jgi:hypothetical protein